MLRIPIDQLIRPDLQYRTVLISSNEKGILCYKTIAICTEVPMTIAQIKEVLEEVIAPVVGEERSDYNKPSLFLALEFSSSRNDLLVKLLDQGLAVGPIDTFILDSEGNLPKPILLIQQEGLYLCDWDSPFHLWGKVYGIEGVTEVIINEATEYNEPW